jgi:hypothetical protein
MSVENEVNKNEVQQSANKAVPTVTSGRDGLSDPPVGGSQSNPIVGATIKFTNDYHWVIDDTDEIDPARKFLVWKVVPTRVKWGSSPLIVEVLEPGEDPRIAELNGACRDEWRPSRFKPGELEGPWQFRFLVQAADLMTMDVFTYPTATVGGCIAVEELKGKTSRMRKMCGDDELRPIVTFDRAPFHTRYDPDRLRPRLAVQAFLNGAGEQVAVPALINKTLPKGANDAEMNDAIKY